MAVGPHHRRRRARGGRRLLLGFGITGAGLAAIVVALAVGVGPIGSGHACSTVRHGPSALSLAAVTVPARSARSGSR